MPNGIHKKKRNQHEPPLGIFHLRHFFQFSLFFFFLHPQLFFSPLLSPIHKQHFDNTTRAPPVKPTQSRDSDTPPTQTYTYTQQHRKWHQEMQSTERGYSWHAATNATPSVEAGCTRQDPTCMVSLVVKQARNPFISTHKHTPTRMWSGQRKTCSSTSRTPRHSYREPRNHFQVSRTRKTGRMSLLSSSRPDSLLVFSPTSSFLSVRVPVAHCVI